MDFTYARSIANPSSRYEATPRVKVDAKHLKQFVDFPLKEGVLASCEGLFCELERPRRRLGTPLHFSVRQADLRRIAYLIFGRVFNTGGAWLLGDALKELF
jgi:hypothetical protein